MKNKYLNLDNILSSYLLIQPVLDALTYFNIKINLVLRGLFLLFCIFYMFVNKSHRKMLYCLIGLSLIYFIYYFFGSGFTLFPSIKMIFLYLYLPIVLLFFSNYKLKDNKIYTIVIFEYLLILTVCYVFNYGNSIYEDVTLEYKHGFKGVFNSINEVGATISALFPISLIYLKDKRKYLLSVLLIFLMILSSAITGSKIIFGFTILTIFYLLITTNYQRIKKLNTRNKIILGISILLLLVLGTVIFINSRVYKNMVGQAKFFNVEKIFSMSFFNRVLFNDRLSFIRPNYISYTTGIVPIILGLALENPVYKLVEMDLFDLLFRFGIVGLIVYLSVFITVFKNLKITKYNSIYFYSIILLLVISLVSGHVLFNPSVSLYFGVLVGYLNNNVKRTK